MLRAVLAACAVSRTTKGSSQVCRLLPLLQNQVSGVRSAGIGSDATAGGTEEPGKVWRAIFYVTPKIVDGSPSDIIAKREIAVYSLTRLRIEWVEDSAGRWHRAASAAWHTGAFRRQYVRFELERGIAMSIVARAVGCAERTKAVARLRTDLERSGIVLSPVGPIRQVGCAIKVNVSADAASKCWTWEAGRIVSVLIAIGTRNEMTCLNGKAHVGLQSSPGHKVAELGGVVLWMEAEVGRSARIDIQGG
jgi:hypothetical protein